ncbi:MAG: hypothetical protein KBT72_14895 [Zhongshania sp.]|jgi:hypothetical protein|nr:hypothetical protein [Zhongshania sp.]
MTTENLAISRHFDVSPHKIRLIAIAMGVYILLVMWPAFDLCRLLLAADPFAFSLQRGMYVTATATVFSLYAYWQMARLCLGKS